MSDTEILEGYILSENKLEYLDSKKTFHLYGKLLALHKLDSGIEMDKEELKKMYEQFGRNFEAKKLIGDYEKAKTDEERLVIMKEITRAFNNCTFSYSRP